MLKQLLKTPVTVFTIYLFVVEFGWMISFHFNHGIAVLKVLKVQALVIPAAFVGTIKEDSEF